MDSRTDVTTEQNSHSRQLETTQEQPKFSLQTWFATDHSKKARSSRWKDCDWTAKLTITTHDIARLMREGFHWSAANVCKEKGFIQTLRREDGHSPHWKKARHYFLTDLSEVPAQWEGWLMVYAGRTSVLSQFRVSDLRPDQAYAATVQPLNGKEKTAMLYAYDVGTPEDCFNAIYDDMPLEGWWPWPKQNGSTAVLAQEGEDRFTEDQDEGSEHDGMQEEDIQAEQLKDVEVKDEDDASDKLSDEEINPKDAESGEVQTQEATNDVRQAKFVPDAEVEASESIEPRDEWSDWSDVSSTGHE